MTAKFNLNDYETVSNRIAKFYAKYETGRIITDLVESNEKSYIIKCTLYESKEDYKESIIFSTGYAQETVGAGYVNKTSALENCETSAIGRALANIGLHGDKRPSREEMIKVEGKKENNEKLIEEIMGKYADAKKVEDLTKVKEYTTKFSSVLTASEIKKLIDYGKLRYSEIENDKIPM